MTQGHGKTLGGGRFELREGLASGGYGEVFRAFDQELGSEVALKVLHRLGPDALLAFKNEFRRLADVRHPNLVRLGELFEENGLFFFSMELLTGCDLWTWVRGGGGDRKPDATRLRDVLMQLCTGLSALHASGLLHRDLKPDNVRVTEDGRVVLLDFGLVSAFRENARESGSIPSGTALYMAPEQTQAGRVGPAVDMYAAGVVLFELLTGQLPFMGSSMKVLMDKHQLEPPHPSERDPDVAPDLDALCLQLLARDPSKRPSASEVLARLGHRAPAAASLRPDEERAFVGRAVELDFLQQAAQRAFAGKLELLLIEGESGVGKTALVRELLTRLSAARPELLILRSRCHAREQLRFKAVDGLLDELSIHLSRLPEAAREAVLPSGAALLTGLFPVLARVPGIAKRQSTRTARSVERHEVFVLLVELIARLASKKPLVFVIDDLHWGDEDSLALLRVLRDLLPNAPVLLIGTLRDLDGITGELGTRLRELALRPHTTRLKLTALTHDDARALGASLLGLRADDARVHELAREAVGHPFFLAELAAHTQVDTGDIARKFTDLDTALSRRMATLGVHAKLTLELLAVAGAPVPAPTLALALRSEGLDAALAELRMARFVRNARGAELICYHDRVREAVLLHLGRSERERLHRRLALAYEHQANVDPAVVADHWLGTADPSRAVPWLVSAAELCVAQAAFERAALLYARLLELDAGDAASRHRHEIALGEALAAAGRCTEAARVIQRALSDANPAERLELSRLSAQRLLQAAEVEAGVAAARDALELVGLSIASSTASALLRVGMARALLSLTAVDGPPPERDSSNDLSRAQLDTLWRLGQPLGWADLLAAAEVAAIHLRLARKTGERRHLALALSAEAVFACMSAPESTRATLLMARADELVSAASAPDVRGYHAMAQGQVAFFRWDLREAERRLLQAEQCLHEECRSEPWLLTNARSVLLGVWFGLGSHKVLSQRTETWLSDATERGDRFALTSIGVMGFGFLRQLMRNEPDAASADISAAMEPWRGSRFGIQHFGATIAEHSVHLAAHQGPRAHEYWDTIWPALDRSFLVKMSFVREVVLVARSRACLLAAACVTGEERKRWINQAKRFVKKASLDHTRFGRATYVQNAAEVALLEGKVDEALVHARDAQALYARAHHFGGRLLDYVIGRIEGGEAGEARAQAVLSWLASEGWVRPEQGVQLFIPSTAIWY